ncbi:phage tail protein [Nostoc sp.]|uniref:phage tail protein n=1 Tax=Nostoc sp. TaxID=1180 RepID=UPI002FF5296E
MSNATVLMAASFAITLKLDGSNDFLDGIFLGCDGFDFTQEVIQFTEVTSERWGKANKGRSRLTKLPGNAVGGNLTLRSGMTISKSLWLWFSSVQKGNWFKQRRTILITFHERTKARAAFQFTEAWPTKYRIGEMKTDTSDVVIEEIEIAYEGFERIST